MVPRAPHTVTGHAVASISSGPISELSTAAISLSRTRASDQGKGLKLNESVEAAALWPHWEGRIGVVLDRPAAPSPFMLAQPMPSGLKLHSMHLLSDYYFSGGFRATAGLVRGATSMPWWPSSQQGSTGLNLSLQRLDMQGLPNQDRSNLSDDPYRTVPYVGAGYSSRLSDTSGYGVWHFNADLGLISINSNNVNRIGRVLQGDQGVDELLRELRLRPVVKFSVNYAF